MLTADATTIKQIGSEQFDSFVVAPVGPQPVANPTDAGPYQLAAQPLFRDGVNFADIRQGGIGDCWAMASFAEVADRDPQRIISAFTENANGTITVRYYPGDNSQPQYMTVDRYLPLSGCADYSQELWVAIYEKVFALIYGGYGRISAGNLPVMGMQLVTGTAWSESATTTLAALEAKVAAGDFICFNSFGSSDGRIVANHSYAFESYDDLNQTILVYNPWGIPTLLPWSIVPVNLQVIDSVKFQ